jgi:hypothetical protein
MNFDRQFDGQQPKQGREFDNRVESDGRCVFERVTHRIADNRRIV